jgi:hypothetical protein
VKFRKLSPAPPSLAVLALALLFLVAPRSAAACEPRFGAPPCATPDPNIGILDGLVAPNMVSGTAIYVYDGGTYALVSWFNTIGGEILFSKASGSWTQIDAVKGAYTAIVERNPSISLSVAEQLTAGLYSVCCLIHTGVVHN